MQMRQNVSRLCHARLIQLHLIPVDDQSVFFDIYLCATCFDAAAWKLTTVQLVCGVHFHIQLNHA